MELGAGAAQALKPREHASDVPGTPDAADARELPDVSGPGSGQFRARLAAGSLALIGVAMAQSSGYLVPDTKFDLVVDPVRFLGRALHLWDPLGAFGQLQNQAYGYLWPMGPFFAAGVSAGLPGWVVQRLWMALVLVVAFLGAARLARALGIRSDAACLITGFAFALSPRMLTTIGPISIEAWPSAVAPWVLLPLVIGAQRGSPRRAAAWSALAVGMVGGVNAAATVAVLPLGVLWLLTRSRGPRRRAMALWWPVFTLLATLWWLVPLFALGAYSPPFLDHIESAGNTTFPTTIVDSFRGTSDWVPYIQDGWRAGSDLLREPTIIVNSAVLLMLGTIGLTLRRNPHRLFLVSGLGLGLLLVSMGHTGSVQGWAAPSIQAALDGALAPLRNVHKFDVVVRLPLVLGVGWSIEAALARWRERGPAERSRSGWDLDRFYGGLIAFAAAVAVLGSALPVVTGRLTPSGATMAVPQYWKQAADWLADQKGTSLLLPGSAFGIYVWGEPGDEPMQALARSPWAVRNAVPLTPPGNIRMLDAIEGWVNQGKGSAALTGYLRRAGVSYLVVRNDLARKGDITDPVLVHQALANSPGIVLDHTFGPYVGGTAHLEAGRLGKVLINGGWQDRYRAIEVFRVQGDPVEASSASQVPVVVGGPEDLLDLQDLGVLGADPTVLATDEDASKPLPTGTPLVLTDGLHAVERSFGRVHDGTSQVRAPTDPRRLGNPTNDYLPPAADRWLTRARVDGIAAVTASSSLADASTSGTVQRGALPYAALDGEPTTEWRSQYAAGEKPWWQVDFDGEPAVPTVTVTASADQDAVFRVVTQHGTGDVVHLPAGRTRVVTVDDDATSWLRIEDATGFAASQLSLAEVAVPGVTAHRSLVLPRLPTDWPAPDRIVLRAVSDMRTGCAEVDGDVRCVTGRAVAAEEPLGFSRLFSLPTPGQYAPQLRVRMRPDEAAQRLLLTDQPVDVQASSEGVPDLRASALAAVDGDVGTTWTASLADFRPTLRLSWLGTRHVVGLRLAVDPNADARLPSTVEVSWPGGSVQVPVGHNGKLSFPPVVTDQLTVRVVQAEPATSLDFASVTTDVPVGISEIRVHHVPFFPVRSPLKPVEFPCGSGPDVVVDGHSYPTSVRASFEDLYAGRDLPATMCGSDELLLDGGQHQVDVRPSAAFTPTSLVLSDGDSPLAASAPVPVTGDGPVADSYGGPRDGDLLATTENANPGWTATSGGRTLPTQTVDGWRQGWTGAAGDRPVSATFAPDRLYRLGLLGGLLVAFAFVVLVTWRSRRWPGADAPPLGTARAPRALLAVVAVVGGGLLAGTVGAVVAAVAWLAAALTRRFGDGVVAVAVAAAVLPAVGAYAVRPLGSLNGWAGSLEWPHYLVVAAVALVLGRLSSTGLGRRVTPRRRWAGSSTRR